MISRFSEHGVEVFDAALDPVRTFALERSLQTHAYSVARSRDRLVHLTEESAVCVDPEGDEVWRFELGLGDSEGPARGDVAFSDDDRHVWLYVPDVQAGRGGEDRWIVLDGATGTEVARHALPTAGLGGSHHSLGDGRMLLDVAEGQDGTWCFTAGPETAVTRVDGWANRVPIDLSPDHRQIMTVDHEQGDVAFHDVTDFATTARIPLSAFGDGEFGDAWIEWTGGFLSAETAIVVVSGENEESEEPWWKHFTVDVRTGSKIDELPISTIDEYDLTPLGDGTYVITDTDGTLRRM